MQARLYASDGFPDEIRQIFHDSKELGRAKETDSGGLSSTVYRAPRLHCPLPDGARRCNVKNLRRLRYISGNQVEAGGVKLQRLPLAAEGDEPMGELEGVLVDLADRRVRYLVVQATDTGRKCLLPIDGTCVHPSSRALERVSAENLDACEPFDASAVQCVDDDAIMSLLFDRSAA